MKNNFRSLFAALIGVATLSIGVRPVAAQTLPPPREATAAQASAGTAGNVYISPRRLASNDIVLGDTTIAGDDLFGVNGLRVTASATTDKNLTLSSSGAGNVIFKYGSNTFGTMLGANGTFTYNGTIDAAGLKIGGVDVGTSSSSYWSADAPGIKYTAGPVSLKGTPTGDNGDLQVEDFTADSITTAGALSAGSINGTVTLGASGPQLGSALVSKAPAAGLVFDGTAGATVSGVPAFGTGGYTCAFWFNPTSLSTTPILLSNAGNGVTIYVQSDGAVVVYSNVSSAALKITAAGTIVTGKTQFLVYSRGQLYLNGIALDSSFSDTDNYTGAPNAIGPSTNFVNGTLRVMIYNRALSASEVVALAEGTVSGSDYNSASNTALNSVAADQNFSSDTGWWTASGVTGWAGSITIGASGYIKRGSLVTPGRKYRVDLTVTTNNGLRIVNDYQVIQVVSGTGALSYEVTWPIANNNGSFILDSTGAGSEVDNLTVTPLGLLLSPDYSVGSGQLAPAQLGTSGSVSWTTGVSWSQPNGNLISLGTTAGNQATIAGDASGGLTVTPKAGQNLSFSGKIIVPGDGTLKWGDTANAGVLTWDTNKAIVTGQTGQDLYLGGRGQQTLTLGASHAATFAGNLTASGTDIVVGPSTQQLTTAGGSLQFKKTGADAALRLTRNAVRDWDIFGGSTLRFVADDGSDLMTLSTGLTGLGVTGNITAGTGGNTVTLAAGAVTLAPTGASQSVTGDLKILKGPNEDATLTLSQGARGTWFLKNVAAGSAPSGIKLTADVAGTIALGNSGGDWLTLGTTGNATFAGSVTAASISSNTTISATGNISTSGSLSGGNITTGGTITAGSGNTTITDATGKILSAALNTVAGANGGTGVANIGKTITLGGNLTTSGAFSTTLTATANTSITLPTSGTLLSDASTITVAQGGTGATSLTANNVILGNGTSAVQFVAPGASGNVLTSNGTTWTSAPQHSSTYAEIYVADGSTAQSIPTGSTYTKVTAFTTDGVSANATAAAASDKITITVAGTYRISWGMSITSDTNNLNWNAAAFAGGVELPNTEAKRKVGTGADVGDFGRNGLVTISSVPVDIDLRVIHSGAGSVLLTPVHANLNVTKIN